MNTTYVICHEDRGLYLRRNGEEVFSFDDGDAHMARTAPTFVDLHQAFDAIAGFAGANIPTHYQVQPVETKRPARATVPELLASKAAEHVGVEMGLNHRYGYGR